MRWPIQAIIFDMDGVLVDSSGIHDWAYREALQGLPLQDFQYSDVAGMRTDEALRVILDRHRLPHDEERIQALAAAKTAAARRRLAEINPIAGDCGSVLRSLAATYRLGLASSASDGTIDQFLDLNRLRGYFASIVYGSQVPSAKPDPAIYLTACERLDVEPQQALIVEDAVSGVQAGKSAGARVVGIAPAQGAAMLRAAGADAVIPRLADLLVFAGERLCQ